MDPAPLERRCVVYRLSDVWLVFSCSRPLGAWLCNGFFDRVSLREDLGDLGHSIEACLQASCATERCEAGRWPVLQIARTEAKSRPGATIAATVARMHRIETVVAGEQLASPRPLLSQVASGDLVEPAGSGDLAARVRAILESSS